MSELCGQGQPKPKPDQRIRDAQATPHEHQWADIHGVIGCSVCRIAKDDVDHVCDTAHEWAWTDDGELACQRCPLVMSTDDPGARKYDSKGNRL